MEKTMPLPAKLPNLSYYNGKVLEPLRAVDEEQLKRLHCGVWSESVPDQLKLVIQQPERYREAIGIINSVAQTKVFIRSYWSILLRACLATAIITIFFGMPTLVMNLYLERDTDKSFQFLPVSFLVVLMFLLYSLLFAISIWWGIRLLLKIAVGQANTLLCEERVLMGVESNSRLALVYVSLDSCRLELSALSLNQGLFKKAILDYSSDYTCCLAKRHFRFRPISNTGHLEGTLCFCQYVICRISVEWLFPPKLTTIC